MFEMSEDPMFLLIGQKFTMANNAAARVLGYESKEIFINTHPAAMSPDVQPDGMSSFDKSIEMINIAYKDGFHRFEWVHKRHNGELFPAEISLTRIPYQQNVALFCVFRDMTDYKMAEKGLVDAKKEADRANQAKSEFLSNMSHELRTPLNAVLGFAQMLELDREGLNETQQDNVKEIYDAGAHLLNLINGILDLNKIEAGQSDISMEKVEITDVIQQSIQLIKTQADTRQIELIDNASKKGHIVNADFFRLKQVMVNILANAVKYNCANGRILIDSAVIDDQYLRISISDTGDGLSEEEIGILFTPFERLNVLNNVEGTGIGLVITKHLIELMSGKIGVDSTLGEGSTFWIELELV